MKSALTASRSHYHTGSFFYLFMTVGRAGTSLAKLENTMGNVREKSFLTQLSPAAHSIYRLKETFYFEIKSPLTGWHTQGSNCAKVRPLQRKVKCFFVCFPQRQKIHLIQRHLVGCRFDWKDVVGFHENVSCIFFHLGFTSWHFDGDHLGYQRSLRLSLQEFSQSSSSLFSLGCG